MTPTRTANHLVTNGKTVHAAADKLFNGHAMHILSCNGRAVDGGTFCALDRFAIITCKSCLSGLDNGRIVLINERA